MFYFLMKYILLGPILRLMYHPKAVGLDNVPLEGGAILASNHQSFLDDLLLPLVVKKRKVVFLAKADYMDKWYLKWFFKGANVIPVRRESRSLADAALKTGIQGLRDGHLIGIFPEGTRSPDGRLYRGKTGVARMALEAQVPVIPVAILGTFEALPYDRKRPKRGRVEVRFGEPLPFERFRDTPTDRFVLRSCTDEILYEIMMLSGQEYVDEYGTKAKKEIDERKAAEAAATSGTAPRPAAERAPADEAVVEIPESAESRSESS